MGELRVYNTLTRREEVFVPREPGKVSIYACGLTPQAPAHVGHMRGVVVVDIVQRWFEHLGYEVNFVQNFTDIDDKIIRRAQEEGISTAEVAAKYSRMYIEDAQALGVRLPRFVKVTEHMDDIIEMVRQLVEDGYAYVVDGDVYFSVERFPEYGKLSGRSPGEMKAGARVEIDERKRNPSTSRSGKPPSRVNQPGTAPGDRGDPAGISNAPPSSLKYLGPSFDIHAGGMDLIFPHHENEIAQSEAYLHCEKPFVRYWLHWGPVRLKEQKMSKSTGVFVPIRELRQQYEPAVIRLFLLSVAYRTPLEFSYERLDEAGAALERVRTAVQRVRALLRTLPQTPTPDESVAQPYREQFTEAMNSDFNTAQALAVAFEVVREMNQRLSEAEGTGVESEAGALLALLNALQWMMETILGIPLETQRLPESELIDQLMAHIIEWRQQLRARKLFDLADRIRDDLKSLGILLEDSPQGTLWRFKGD
jgi:cysteinyl-tRNA synthetase